MLSLKRILENVILTLCIKNSQLLYKGKYIYTFDIKMRGLRYVWVKIKISQKRNRSSF